MEARLLKLTFAAPILIGLSSGCTGLDTAASDEPGSVIVAVKSAPAPPPIVRSAEPPGEVRPLFRPLVRQRAKATPPPVAVVRPRRMLEPAPRHPPLPQPVEAPDREPPLYFTGVTVIQGETTALIEEPDRSQGYRVREGETVGDYRVARITGESVQLARGRALRTLQLGEGKEGGGLESFGTGTALAADTDRSGISLTSLPAPVRSTLARVLPRTGELRRVRTDRDNGQMVYQVEKRVDGLDWEIRVGPSGEILRIEQDLRVAALPPPVVQAANAYRTGYQINPDDTPKLMDRGGERYYEVEVRQIGGRDEVDLRIAPSGHILNRG